MVIWFIFFYIFFLKKHLIRKWKLFLKIKIENLVYYYFLYENNKKN